MEKICRLCLQTISDNLELSGESLYLLLEVLKLNLNITKGNVMCTECAYYLKIFLKTASVYRRDGISPLPYLENDANVALVKIETPSYLESRVKTEIKCSFCVKTGGREDFVPLNESKKYESLLNMLKQYVPEMNLNNTEELLTCERCLDELQGVASFIFKCLEVEEAIRKYIKMEGTNKGQIELKDVQQFGCRTLKLEAELFEGNPLGDGRSDEIKMEYVTTAETEIKYEDEVFDPELIIKPEHVDIKTERSDSDRCQESFIKSEIPGDPLETKREENIEQDTIHKQNLNLDLCTHRSPSEINMFKCELCPYEVKRRFDLKRHLLIHKTPSEMKMFKCESCPYEAKCKKYLKRHLLTHRSPSEMKMFKCESCPYEAKCKKYLKQHLLTHKSPSEMKMFECEICTFKTTQKSYLKSHSLVHKSLSELSTFRCATCSFVTKRERYLQQHLLTHKSPSEMKMYKCALCSYQTKQKSHLGYHLLTHKSPSEINMFKCELCSYEAKRKDVFKRHLLTHKSPLEVKMFKCETCPYEAKHKHHLKQHLLIHKDR